VSAANDNTPLLAATLARLASPDNHYIPQLLYCIELPPPLRSNAIIAISPFLMFGVGSLLAVKHGSLSYLRLCPGVEALPHQDFDEPLRTPSSQEAQERATELNALDQKTDGR
jgi:hypothetical protein